MILTWKKILLLPVMFCIAVAVYGKLHSPYTEPSSLRGPSFPTNGEVSRDPICNTCSAYVTDGNGNVEGVELWQVDTSVPGPEVTVGAVAEEPSMIKLTIYLMENE